MQNSLMTVYTIGHGRHAWTDFPALENPQAVEEICFGGKIIRKY